MQFNVAGLLKDDVGATRAYTLEVEVLTVMNESFESVHGLARMTRTNRGILVEAEVRGTAVRSCSRCLNSTVIELDGEVEEEFRPSNWFGGIELDAFKSARDQNPSDALFVIDEKNVLDLSEAVRQALSTAIPIAPVCKPDCLGICPHCATDRNRASCSCEDFEPHPIFADLKRMMMDHATTT